LCSALTALITAAALAARGTGAGTEPQTAAAGAPHTGTVTSKVLSCNCFNILNAILRYVHAFNSDFA